ncbi:hypothetical protein [Jeotgalibacillus marinus]|uniref:Uncharacterized protein n=1 Tax=Jeotgalibacillus marinus TaxID=86667 RepID=A0ABV3Q439_9BACL
MTKEYSINIKEVNVNNHIETTQIPKSSGVNGGVLLTGFIVVDNIVVTSENDEKKLLVESNLPFQIMVIDLDTSDDNVET